MKIAYLLGSLERGGTETLLLDVFNHENQIPFGLIGVYRKDGALSENFHRSGTPVFKLSPGRAWMLWLYLWRLRKLLKREKVDLVHAQQNLDAIYARTSCIGLPIKVIQTFHSFDFGLSRFGKSLIKLSMKMTDLNIFVSREQQTYYTSVYKLSQHTKKAVVYNGINVKKFNCKVENLIRIELDILLESFLLGMVANFVPGHDQITVCRFLDLLNKKGVDFTFLFIGKKDDRNPYIYEDCISFCQNNSLASKVIFLGSRPDVPAILPQLDAFIYSSEHDTFGIAVIEALATGIPVFVNDWEVMKEITDNGKRANLYRTKDENDLLDNILFFLKQPETYKKAALENAKWAHKTYSIQSHIDTLYEVYNGIN